MVHSAPALPQGLVPPSQGSKAGAEQTPGLGRAGRGVGPHCPPDPAEPHHSPQPLGLLLASAHY